jgi:hypothetical protein
VAVTRSRPEIPSLVSSECRKLMKEKLIKEKETYITEIKRRE